jgi:hypothetical protein
MFFGLAVAVLLTATAPSAFSQDTGGPYIAYTKTVPVHGSNSAKAHRASAAGAAVNNLSLLPLWSYSVTSPIDDNNYSGVMVGANPNFNGARTTNVPVVIVPVIVKTPDGGTFDPTAADKCSTWGNSITQILASPIFAPAQFTMNGINMGSGQYIDEFQRANFYDTNVEATGNSYHTVLSPTTIAAQTFNVPANEGELWFLGGCASVGIVDYSTFDSYITGTLLPALSANGLVTPASLVIFVIHDVVMGDPGTNISSNCCVIGYHSGTGSPVQTYVVADFDTSHTFQNPDIQPLSHEVGAWMDDPLVNNPTPSWGHVAQVTQCETILEAGDPLNGFPPALYQQSGTYGVTMTNGHTYYPQDLAFFSWFYRQRPSLGAGGIYSAGGTFLSPQSTICQ